MTTETPGAKPVLTTAAGTLTRLLRRAHEARRLLDAVPMLTTGAEFLPAFRFAADLENPPRRVFVGDGHTRPQLICVPSFLAGSGPHQFVRLAVAFDRRPRTSALTLPGFDRGGPVPMSWTAALDALAVAARAAAAGEPFVLVGHSIGGVVAHSLARRLARTGTPASGVVLIDTFDPGPERRDDMLGWALGSVFDRDREGLVVNDDNLLAMGAYLRVFADWQQVRPLAPVLRVSAEESPWPVWDVADTTATVAADHFSVLEDHAGLTAKAIDAWLSSLADS